MIEYIEHDKVNDVLKKYLERIGIMGYVQPKLMKTYMKYLFLYDFTETVYPFITGEDYKRVDILMAKLFKNGGCLLPYKKNFAKYKAAIGSPVYMGKISLRTTEDGFFRRTESDNLRAVI